MAKDSLSPPGSFRGKSSAKTRKARKSVKRSGSKRSSRKSSKRTMGRRFGAIKGDLMKYGVFVGQVAGASALASAASGYLGDKMQIGTEKYSVDARLLAAAAVVANEQLGLVSLGSWKAPVQNMTAGVLSSWLNEKAFAFGAEKAVPAAIPAAAPAEGMVIGNVYGDEVGLFKRNPEKVEQRLERKLLKLKSKASKKGVDWQDVAEEAREDRQQARRRVIRRAPPVAVLPPPRRRLGFNWFRRARAI